MKIDRLKFSQYDVRWDLVIGFCSGRELMISFVICLAIAYLVGSVSTGVLVSKYMGGTDPRSEGSGNPGATNVLRLNGKNQAILVLVGDILKGTTAIVIARLFHVTGFELGLVGLAAVVGHIFPAFFEFKGGKGVATMIGVCLGLSLWLGALVIVSWLVTAIGFRFSSLAALVAAALAPFYALFFSSPTYFIPLAFITLLVVWKHMDNIQKLRSGSEDKIDFSKFMS